MALLCLTWRPLHIRTTGDEAFAVGQAWVAEHVVRYYSGNGSRNWQLEQVVHNFSPSIRAFQALLGTIGVSPYRRRIGGLMTGNRAW